MLTLHAYITCLHYMLTLHAYITCLHYMLYRIMDKRNKLNEADYRTKVLGDDAIKRSAQCLCTTSQHSYRCPNGHRCFNEFKQGDATTAIRTLRTKFFPPDGKLADRKGWNLYMGVHIDAYGCMWVYIGVCRCMWVHVGVCRCMWVYAGACGCMWVHVCM
jgi:hypothetical protein